MAINVFPWPPVGVIGSEWTEVAPVARLRSLMTGREQMQASQRKRKVVTLQVSALAAGGMGAGYCEMLKQLLEGGIHAVRIKSSPINWHLDELRRQGLDRNGGLLAWRAGSGPDPLVWRAGSGPNPLRIFSGTVIEAGTATASGMWWHLPVSGLPPRTQVAAPGEYIRIHSMVDDALSEVARVVRVAVSNASGAVTLRLDRQPSIANGRVNMAGQDEAVFRVDGAMPRSVQPVGADWSYTWNFREVFADEVGGFTERNPWT